MADNWFHKKGVTYNRTLFSYTIPNVGDEAQGTRFRYVAKWGNDILGNGSRANPYASINKASLDCVDNNWVILVGTGVYRETVLTSFSVYIIGDTSLVTMEGIGLTYALYSTYIGNVNKYCYNLRIQNYQYAFGANSAGQVFFSKCVVSEITNNLSANDSDVKFGYMTLFEDSNKMLFRIPSASAKLIKCTFVKIRDLIINNIDGLTIDYRANGNVFWNNNIQFINRNPFQYCLFFQNNYRFNASFGMHPSYTPFVDNVQQSVPTGFNYYSTLAALSAAHNVVFSPTSFQNCVVADPLFNGKEIGDFSLSGSSPARNMDYDGYQAGAFRIGNSLKINALSGSSNFINTGATNLSFSTDSTNGDYASLTTDSTADIKSNVLDLGGFYILKNVNLYGLIADRNGEWFSNERDLSASTISSGTTVLTTGNTYVVETNNIVWSGNTLTPSSKFSVLSTSSTSFSGTGVVREIWQKPLIQNFNMRFSDSSFTADDVSPSYFNFRWNEEISVNRTGNLSSGSPTYGNGDINFDNTVENIFSLQTRYLQFWVKIQNDNLV